MKKWYLIILAAIIIAVVFFLPAEKTLIEKFDAPCPYSAPTRLMTDQKQWKKWWPGEMINDTSYKINERIFAPDRIMLNEITALNRKNETEILLNVQFTSVSGTQTGFTVISTYRFSRNRFKRMWQYFDYLKWKDEHKIISARLLEFFSDTKKIYGYNIEKKKIPNSPHLAITQEFVNEPDWNEIYGLINELKEYVASQQGKVVNDPIMNIFVEQGKFKVMVAVATDRILPSTDRYMLKQMVLGNQLEIEVKGSNFKIREAQAQIENYLRDYGKTFPAIPFQRLITDRSKETDSTKWITTLNYPIFE